MKNEISFRFFGKDFSAGLVVFLVALPLCLGISLASDAPLFSGIIAGIVGGIVVGFISGSRLGVSGPAAGLAVIVASAIHEMPSYEVFLVSVVLAGVFQLGLGLLGAGKIVFFFPSSVIKGMLAAIGITIILKQIPHLFGIDSDPEGDFEFIQPDGENTLSELFNIVDFIPGALIVGLLSLALLILWNSKGVRNNRVLSSFPGPLLAVIMGLVLNYFFPASLKIGAYHLVSLPVLEDLSQIHSILTFPDFSAIGNYLVLKTAVVIAIIASLETLLCVEATDRLDPEKHITPTNRELFAQGTGNIVSGLIGGIPVTQVIVRSSANIMAGGKTKMAAIIHGFMLVACVLIIPAILNQIPLSALAAILIMVGFKLARPSLFVSLWKEGQDQFVPFTVTIVAVLFTDLLVGILVGFLVGIGYVVFTNFKSAITLKMKGRVQYVEFIKDVFFYNRSNLLKVFSELEEGDEIVLDGSKMDFIDHDIFLTIQEFVEDSSKRGIKVTTIDITRKKLGFKDFHEAENLKK